MKYYFFIILFVIFSTNLYSQEEELYEESEAIEEIEEIEEDLSHSEIFNEIGLFIGATSFTGAGSWTSASIGLEYERVLSTEPHVFMGLYGEYITGEHSEFLTGLPIGIEFFGIKTYLAPSVLFSSGHTELHTDEHGEVENFKNSDIKFFLRFGAGYKFHFDHFSIVPNMAVDIISGKTYLVYGVTLGYGF
jgi:hypothetical protein